MKYLAFDIEAANGYMLSSVCSIGVVIADEQFNVLSRRNIWINPRTKYNLNGTRPGVGIDLHLDKKVLAASPDFRKVYPTVKALLTDEQYTVVGHAVDSDVRMLNKACQRYRLPSINFRFLCTQLLYKMYKGDSEVKGLSKIADDIGLTFSQHNSEEDAYASLMTLRYLVQDSGLSTDELVQKFCIRLGSNTDFELVRPVSMLGQVSHKQVTQQAIERIKQHFSEVKRVDTAYKNKVFCLARSLELSDSDELYALLDVIGRHGGRYTAKLYKGNCYVRWGQSTPQDVMREKRVEELCQQGLMTVVDISDVMEERI